MHDAAVHTYFADHPDSLVEFDISTDSVDKLMEFFRTELGLGKGIWAQVGKTGAGVPKEMAASAEPAD